MSSKIVGLIAAVAVAVVVAGRASLAGHGPSVWAQEADDQAADTAAADSGASEDASPSANEADDPEAKQKPKPTPTPVSASGVYSGTVMDNNGGAGTISAAIIQAHSKITGTWQDTFVPPAFIVGTINAKEQMTLRMRFHLTGNCGYLFSGTFQNGDQISGTYKLDSCPKKMGSDHGTLNMTKQ